MEGHFAEGAAGTMVLTGGIEVPVTLELVEPGARYLDRLEMGDLRIHIDHVVKDVDGGAEVTVSTYHHRPGRRGHRPDGDRRRAQGDGGPLRDGRGALGHTSTRSPSATATAASAWVRIESRTGSGESVGSTSSSISVQPSTTACDAGVAQPLDDAGVRRPRASSAPAEGELVEDDPVHLVALGGGRARRRSARPGRAGRRRSPPPSPTGCRARRAATSRPRGPGRRWRRRCGGGGRRWRPARRRPRGA